MDPLKLDVVNGQNGFQIGKFAVRPIMGVKQTGDHGGMPIIQMENIRHKIHRFSQCFQNSTLEKAEPFNVKRVIKIELIMIKIEFVVNKVDRNTIQLHPEKTTVQCAPAQPDHRPAQKDHLVGAAILDAFVQRHDHTHIGTGPAQSTGQRADDITQSAGPGQRT